MCGCKNSTLNLERIKGCLIVRDRECMNCFLRTGALSKLPSYQVPHPKKYLEFNLVQLDASRRLWLRMLPHANADDLQVGRAKASVQVLLPGRPIGLTQARVSNVVLCMSIQIRGQGRKRIWRASIGRWGIQTFACLHVQCPKAPKSGRDSFSQ